MSKSGFTCAAVDNEALLAQATEWSSVLALLHTASRMKWLALDAFVRIGADDYVPRARRTRSFGLYWTMRRNLWHLNHELSHVRCFLLFHLEYPELELKTAAMTGQDLDHLARFFGCT